MAKDKYVDDPNVLSTPLLRQVVYQGHPYTILKERLPLGKTYQGLTLERNSLYNFTPKVFQCVGGNATVVHRVEPLYNLTALLESLIQEQVRLLHLKGYGHGNLTPENIVIYKNKPYFIGFEYLYELGRHTLKRESLLRAKGYQTLQQLVLSDYTSWGDYHASPTLPQMTEIYQQRFLIDEWQTTDPVYLNSLDFARLFKVTLNDTTVHYIAKVGIETYLDTSGIYLSYDDAIEGAKAWCLDEISSIVVEEVEHEPIANEDQVKDFRDYVLRSISNLYIPPREHTHLPQEVKLPIEQIDVVSRLSIRYRHVFSSILPADYELALKMLDTSAVMNTNLLSTAFMFVKYDPVQVSRIVLGINDKDTIEDSIAPLVEFAIKHYPRYVATIFLHAVNIEGPMPWLYEALSRNIEQAKIILAELAKFWDVHYSYVMLLIESYSKSSTTDSLLAKHLVRVCLRSSYFRILAYYQWHPSVAGITVDKLDSYFLETRRYPQVVGVNYPDKPFREMIGQYPMHHYLAVSREELADVIIHDLDKIEPLILVGKFWADLKELVVESLKLYNENTQRLVTLTLEKFY